MFDVRGTPSHQNLVYVYPDRMVQNTQGSKQHPAMSYQPSLEDRRDYEDAERGFISSLTPGVIKAPDGRVVWDIDEYAFLQQECASTAHPHLWRQGQLNSKQGLFEIQPGIYQVRALDLSNMTIVEGKEGIIIIDPLVSCECAAAGLALYQAHRGNDRRVTGMIYSHSHGDHYMGAQGVLPEDQDMSIPIIAPEGFLEAIMSESVLAGPAMRNRAAFMYGNALPRGPTGQIGVGLGMGSSKGSTSLIPPNTLIKETGEEHIVDGVRIVFQMVPGSEAPAEVNFHFPDFRALCVPETATNCMHNIVCCTTPVLYCICLLTFLISVGYASRSRSTRCKGVVGLSRRVHCPVRFRVRCRLWEPQLADMGPEGTNQQAIRATGYVRIPSRPDRANDESR